MLVKYLDILFGRLARSALFKTTVLFKLACVCVKVGDRSRTGSMYVCVFVGNRAPKAPKIEDFEVHPTHPLIPHVRIVLLCSKTTAAGGTGNGLVRNDGNNSK